MSNYRVIVNDLAKKLIDESEATEKEFTQAILTANVSTKLLKCKKIEYLIKSCFQQQLELVDNQAQSEWLNDDDIE